MKITLDHDTYENCTLVKEEYSNKRPAFVIYHNDEVLLKASVNMPYDDIPEGYVCIKNWSENSGILDSLIDADVIYPPEYQISSGFVAVDVCRIKQGD